MRNGITIKIVLVMVGLFALICPTLPTWADTWTKLAGQEGYLEWRAVAEDESEELVRASTTDVWDGGLEINVTVPSVSALPLYDPDENEYIQLRSPGCGATAQQVGFPEMPFKGFFVEIPYGVVVSVDIQDKKSTLLGTGLKVYPLQPPQPDSGKAENNSFQIDQNAYATNSFFPSDCVVLDEPGIIRGRRVVFVQVFPFQYNPATTELRAFSSLRFTLNFKGSADPSEQVRKQKLATDVSESLAKRLILNYKPITPSRSKGESELSTGPGADYLIIVADTLYDETLPLAEWKHKKGFITRIVTMSSVGSTAADVKNYIQNAYDNWTPAPSYVLLVGDSEDVPPDYFSGTLACTTDNPYACVDGTDYYPDLTLGRLPVHTETECTNVVDKILYYDRTPDLGSWYDEFLSAGYFQDYDNDDGVADRWFMETTMTVYDFLVNEEGWYGNTALCTSYWPLHYSTWHFRSSSYPHRGDINLIRWGTSPYPDPVPQWIVDLWTSAPDSTQDVTDAINAGVSIVQHRDHGAETLWGDPPYGISNINSLSNGVKTPVVFSTNCLTGSFHWSGGDCFCEAFLKKSPGGCVGIVGATRLSYSGYNDLLVHGTYTSFWPSYDPTYIDTTYPHSWRPAQALNFGKYYMLTYEGTGDYTAGEFYMFHWFGDPEMPLRTETPQSLAVTHPSAVVAVQPTDITIDVTRGGLPLENALVCISHPTADDHWSGLTDALGSITFSGITLIQLGENYDIVVSERNSVPYEGIIYAGLSDCGIINLDREAYSCDDTITIFVADLGLQGSGIQDVTVTTSGGDFETVTLTENPINLGLFEEWILTCTGDPNAEDGRLQVAHGETITATYEDPNYCGTGNPETVQDTATADCQSPTISNVQTVNVGFDSTTITFETDEITTGRVRYGLVCGGPNTIVEDLTFATAHSIDLTGLSISTPYFFMVDASDSVNNFATNSNNGSCYTFTTLDFPDDYFTELFDAADNDVDNISITFIPDGTVNYYTACVELIDVLPTDPSGGTSLPLSDDDYEPVPLSGGATVSLYGESYGNGEVWAGSNGYLTFGAGDTDYTESYADHFDLPRISALFDDFNPSSGGLVSHRQLGDRLAVTWENVPEYGTSNANTFQIEMFFNGQIRISWLAIEATDGLAGLSEGLGIPPNFTESDLSEYPPCDCLIVSPDQGFFPTGPEGGPFTPLCKTYRLTNTCDYPIDWTAEWSENWLDVIPPADSNLLPEEYVDVNVCIIEAIANNMSMGDYYDTVIFTNLTTEYPHLRDVTLNILPPPTPPVAEDTNVSVCREEPKNITLEATDDGLPDPPGDLTYIIWTLPAHGSLVDPASGPITDPNTPLVGYGDQVEYTPDGGYTGPDEFTFKANDGGFWPTGGDSNEATVSIDVLDPPPPPTDPDPNDGAIDVPVDTNLTWNGSSSPDTTGSLTTPETTGSLTTTFAGGNGQDGNMFDLTAKKTITITGWDGNIDAGGGPATIEVYYVTDHTTYVGKEANSALWTLLDSVTLPTTNPAGTPTSVAIGGLTIASGETVGIYWTTISAGVDYTDGPLGVFENTELRFEDRGTGNAYPFGTVYSPRVWNGTIHYEVGGGGSCDTMWDVYFGTEDPPTELIYENLTEPTCDPGPLETCMKYYWQVVAKNCCGQTPGEVWEFTTEGLFLPAPSDPDPNDGAIDVPTDTNLSWNGTVESPVLVSISNAVSESNNNRLEHEKPLLPAGLPAAVKTEFIPESAQGCYVFGGTSDPWTGSSRLRGNVYTVDDSQTLTEIKMILNFTGSADLYYYVLESTSLDGLYTPVFEQLVPTTGVGQALYSSGSISVTLEPGKYHGIGVTWGSETITYYRDLLTLPRNWELGTVAKYLTLDNITVPITTPITPLTGTNFAEYAMELCFGGGGSCDTMWDVYFGTEDPPTELIYENLTEPTCDPCDPGLLYPNTTYYWQVISKNACACDTTVGPIWTFTSRMLGDFDGDYDVDIDDFIAFVMYWMEVNCGECGGADLTGDGDVDASDFGKFSTLWLEGTEP